VSLPAAIMNVYRNYATFSGRASRSEYWWFHFAMALFYMGTYGALLALEPGILEDQIAGDNVAALVIAGLILLVSVLNIVPTLAVLVRRLHDTNRSGWHYFITLIPWVGSLILFIYTLLPGTPGNNRYGGDPHVFAYGSRTPPAPSSFGSFANPRAPGNPWGDTTPRITPVSTITPATAYTPTPAADPGMGTMSPPQPQYGQAQYGQAPYEQAEYGQAEYGQAQYGQAQYGQAEYGQAQYGQAASYAPQQPPPPYVPQQFAPPPQPPQQAAPQPPQPPAAYPPQTPGRPSGTFYPAGPGPQQQAPRSFQPQHPGARPGTFYPPNYKPPQPQPPQEQAPPADPPPPPRP